MRVREDRFASQMTDVIGQKLFTPEFMEFLVPSVVEELNKLLDRGNGDILHAQVRTTEGSLAECKERIAVILDNMEQSSSLSLRDRLKYLESDKIHLEQSLKTLRASARKRPTSAEIGSMIEGTANLLRDALQADPETGRDMLSRSIRQLTLFPNEEGGQRHFEVFGQVDVLPEIDVTLGGLLDSLVPGSPSNPPSVPSASTQLWMQISIWLALWQRR